MDVPGAELILVMEQGHKAELEQRFPLVRGKVFRLGELGEFDIADPYRQPRAAFEAAYRRHRPWRCRLGSAHPPVRLSRSPKHDKTAFQFHRE